MADRSAAIASSRAWFTKRRGLLAAAAAVVAGTLQQSRAEVAHADTVSGTATSAGGVGVFGANGFTSGSGTGILGQSDGSGDEATGITGTATATTGRTYGVNGGTSSTSTNASGVKGKAYGASGITNGVWGVSLSNSVNATGVKGEASGAGSNGVWGTNTSTTSGATGVFGTATATSGGAIGVWGRSSGTDAAAKGVYGVIDTAGATGTGVYGQSTSGIGVYGQSTNNYGMQGVTLKTGYAGLVGVGSVAGSAGFYALGVNGATAGTFQGDVVINGSLTVTGTFPKSAAVKKKDGTLARMYCVEAPESWFEDFGTATLVNGQASVPLDSEFDQVVNGNDYRIFLTPVGVECGSLYVSRKGPHRFEVRSFAGNAASGSFDYRVVARRLDDVGKRLEKVEVPTMAPIDVPRLTQTAEPAGRK